MAASFTREITILAPHIDALQHANNLAYLQFALDIAGAHWESVVPPDFPPHYGWMIRRHEIDYLNQAFLGDVLTLTTWVGASTNVTWERHTTMTRLSDGKLIVKALSTWMLVDTVRQRPVRLDAVILGYFGVT